MSEFKFGDKVRTSKKLVRKFSHHGEHRKDWVAELISDRDSSGKVVATSHEGIIIGKRTLANGKYQYGSYDEQASLYQVTHVTAYLVAFDMRRKPILVFAEDLEHIE